MSTAVSVEGQFASIPEVLTTIQAKIKSLGKIETTKFKTKGDLPGFPTNIQKEEKVETLIAAYSSVRGRAAAFADAATDLGVTVPEFSVGGGTVAEWKHDIDLRIKIVTQSDELKKLRKLEEEASKFLSQEDQKSIFFQKLIKELGA